MREGFVYDRTGPSPIGDLLLFNGVNLLRLIVNNPVIQNPGQSDAASDQRADERCHTGPEGGDSILSELQPWSRAPGDGEEHVQRSLRGIAKHRCVSLD
jgi:hypothetical protein